MQEQEMVEILDRYPPREESLIEVLHDVQLRLRHLPRPALERVSQYLGIPIARVLSAATFYKTFSLSPKGERIFKVCMGTACHVKGAGLIKEEAERLLGIKAGETSPDGRYSLDLVNCVGACAMAPLVIEEESYHGNFRPVDFGSMLYKGE